MKTFNSIEKSYHKQRALAYIVYMMAGSYFSLSSSAFSPLNLYLHYAEMPREKQYQYESRVISSLEALGKDFLQNIAGYIPKYPVHLSDNSLSSIGQSASFN